MKILVINSGSSSIKFQLFEMSQTKVLASGILEGIGEEKGMLTYKSYIHDLKDIKLSQTQVLKDHSSGLQLISKLLLDKESGALMSTADLQAVGHRVVHGGEHFNSPVQITKEVLAQLKKLSFLAPLHNPLNIKGIELSQKIFPQALQVAVFDTAFHQTMPNYVYRFSVPNKFYKKHKLRVYGFHGSSHAYVSREAANFLKIAKDHLNAITVHLGNGCSIAAIQGGKSVDVSMGLTPMGGLMMGTRSGDVDPSLLIFMAHHLKMSFAEIETVLNKESGLIGLTNDNDMRRILARYKKADPEARLAITMYVYRIKKYIGSYMAILPHVDALIFTAGVGENSSFIRELVCDEMQRMGIKLDASLNEADSGIIREIGASDSPVKLLVIPTNEELEIANETLKLLGSNQIK